MTFIYPTDIDLIYETEDELLTELDPQPNITNGGTSRLVNTLKFNIAPGTGSNITVTPDAGNESISQFQEVIIKGVLDSTFKTTYTYSGLVVIMHVALPNATTLTNVDDFDFHIHLMPDFSTREQYKVNLTEFVGMQLKVGTVNTLQYKFQVLYKNNNTWTTLTQSDTKTIGLYKTNTSESFKADDLANAFAVLSKLNEYVEEHA